MKLFFRRYFELGFWFTSLVLLAYMEPGAGTHYSFCIFKFIGINFCPGCGIGHAISFLLHGDIRSSLSAHPLGIFALAVITFRIIKLTSLHIFSNLKKYDHAIR